MAAYLLKLRKVFCVRRFRSQHGFTLFEVIVAITIIALIMGVVISRMDDYLDLEMKKTSRKLASTMRYLYNKSATERLYVRLVLDMSEQTYWVEATTEPFIMKKTQDLEKKEEKEAREEEAEGEVATTSEEEEKKIKIPKLKLKTPSFTQEESFLLKPTKMPDNVLFKNVMTEHHPTPIEGGQAAIYFFPNGYVEHAIINITDEDEEVYYSLETNPITGSVSIENEYRTLEKE